MSIILAILGLSFLIFIHELGHYFMARRVGMRVEIFSIGFGRPLLSWNWHGCKWQLGWLPFGGYVKVAGTDSDDKRDLYQIPDGFFGRGPWARIKVAFMGPFVNLVFAILAFSLVWVSGGREKNFSEYTTKIGWVDPQSELYQQGIRPGDEIYSYNGHDYNGSRDHLQAPMTSPAIMRVAGVKIDYTNGKKASYNVNVKPYSHPASPDATLLTGGILQPASYILYDRLSNGGENPLPQGSPLLESGIEYGDRLVWVDGHLLFSVSQMTALLNEGKALLTVQRGDPTFLVQVPRFPIQDYKIDRELKEEIIDWQFESRLGSQKTSQLLMIPYNLTATGVVEGHLKFLENDLETRVFGPAPNTGLNQLLEPGDKILAIDGTPIDHSAKILALLQKRNVQIIVQRGSSVPGKIHYENEDDAFDFDVDWPDVEAIASTIGTPHPVQKSGRLVLLKPVQPRPRSELISAAFMAKESTQEKSELDKIEDPDRRAKLATLLENKQKELIIGLPMIQDRTVVYNPIPTQQFWDVLEEIGTTLKALVTGILNPKWLNGPVGIVNVIREQVQTGLNDAIYWLGAISLNLGILNLLPIPMLDGGTILFAFVEMITGKAIKPKTLERLLVPFALLLIVFFLFLTYNDLSRIFGGWVK